MTFSEANKENIERSRLVHEGLLDPTDYEKKYTLLRKYITRGGFIKDQNGRWCKEGDKVRFTAIDEDNTPKIGFEEVLVFTNQLVFSSSLNRFCCINEYHFELVEPCEPDICKYFEEE